jgi:hypothetical protein
MAKPITNNRTSNHSGPASGYDYGTRKLKVNRSPRTAVQPVVVRGIREYVSPSDLGMSVAIPIFSDSPSVGRPGAASFHYGFRSCPESLIIIDRTAESTFSHHYKENRIHRLKSDMTIICDRFRLQYSIRPDFRGKCCSSNLPLRLPSGATHNRETIQSNQSALIPRSNWVAINSLKWFYDNCFERIPVLCILK